MKIRRLHTWPRSVTAAIALQQRLAAAACQVPLERAVRLVAAADVAFPVHDPCVVAGVVVWDVATQRVVEQRVARARRRFPYVPGLLSFRELPCVLAAFRRLCVVPDVVLCDGQGLAHPRGCGLATHLGLWIDLPTIGCAKSRLCGEHAEPATARGSSTDLMLRGACVGRVVRTRTGARPLYVSVGHRCDLDGAVGVVLATARRFRLPEPARLAHQLVTRARALVPRAQAGW